MKMFNMTNSQKMSLKAKMKISQETTEMPNDRERLHKLAIHTTDTTYCS